MEIVFLFLAHLMVGKKSESISLRTLKGVPMWQFCLFGASRNVFFLGGEFVLSIGTSTCPTKLMAVPLN